MSDKAPTFAHKLEDRAPLPGEWSIETADKITFTDHRDCPEARLGNFLRTCAAAWHPAHLHKMTFGNEQLQECGEIYAQSELFGQEMREKLQVILEELDATRIR